MKECSLCDMRARVYCESDRASLCWDCDAKVHGANFLVARHSRCLLCRSCRAVTPWKASGPRLGPTVSVCDACISRRGKADEDDEYDRHDDEDEDEEEEEDVSLMCQSSEGEEEEDSEEEDGENQVVPWAMGTMMLPASPPVASCSSSSDESSSSGGMGICDGLVNRTGGNVDLAMSKDDLVCSTSQRSALQYSTREVLPRSCMVDRAMSIDEPFWPSKEQKITYHAAQPHPPLLSSLVNPRFKGRSSGSGNSSI